MPDPRQVDSLPELGLAAPQGLCFPVRLRDDHLASLNPHSGGPGGQGLHRGFSEEEQGIHQRQRLLGRQLDPLKDAWATSKAKERAERQRVRDDQKRLALGHLVPWMRFEDGSVNYEATYEAEAAAQIALKEGTGHFSPRLIAAE